jgi:aldehyde dehydrogenase (NAD+)
MTDRIRLHEQLAGSRSFFLRGGRYTVAERRAGLDRLRRAVRSHQDKLCAALYLDLGKSEFEAKMTEIMPLLECLDFLYRKLPSLARPKWVATSIVNFPAAGRLYAEPYGLALIFGTWNYPLLLALEPLAGALAAGNRVVLSLSNQAPATSQLIRELLEKCFVNDEVTVADRGCTFDQLLEERFDYIFFTGGAAAGRQVMRRAAEHLTPVTLELGGKSPCIVDRYADLKVAARRIVWGKFLNAGQTCVAPDYLLVHREVKLELLREMRHCVQQFYGANPMDNPDFPRIVNDTHFERLSPLLTRGRLVTGGEKNPAELRIAPTIIDQIDPDDPVMDQEIFGPILPVLEISSLEEAAAFVNGREKPLALYFFGRHADAVKLINCTSSGGVAVNETITHFANPAMPFGGVGASGMGAYHGRHSFDTFSHRKPVMFKWNLPELSLRYPPFARWKQKVLNWLCR